MENKETAGAVAAMCFIAMAMILVAAVIYSMGKESGIVEGHYEARPTISTGQPPVGVPILLFWIEENGTVYAASAMKTDYAGILPFSTTASAVPFEVYADFDYWMVLDNTFAGVKP